MKQFNNAADPILLLVDSYFRKKKVTSNNMKTSGAVNIGAVTGIDESLPEYPMKLVRGDDGKVARIIYGDINALASVEGEESSVVIWQESFVRDENGKVTHITTTYPSGLEVVVKLNRNTNNKVESMEAID